MEPPAKKQKGSDLEERIKQLEKDRTDEVKDLKNKVRSLALQQNPSVPLLLLLLDELAPVAKRAGHSESTLFEELSRHSHLNEKSIDVSSFVLQVLGGRASDVISKALEKATRDSASKSEKAAEPKTQQIVPPQSFLPMGYGYPMQLGGYGPAPYGPAPYGGGYARGSRPYRGGRYNNRNGSCHYCGRQGHFPRECPKMNEERLNTNRQ